MDVRARARADKDKDKDKEDDERSLLEALMTGRYALDTVGDNQLFVISSCADILRIGERFISLPIRMRRVVGLAVFA